MNWDVLKWALTQFGPFAVLLFVVIMQRGKSDQREHDMQMRMLDVTVGMATEQASMRAAISGMAAEIAGLRADLRDGRAIPAPVEDKPTRPHLKGRKGKADGS